MRTTADITRLMTMSIADLLDDWFESPQVKGALAVNGVIGTWAGPCEPGTAYVMAHHSIGDVGDGQLGSWGYPEGGMGAVPAAIAAAAREFGAEIRTNARVDRLIVHSGRVHGAVLADGREVRAPLVVTTLHPKIAFLDQVPRTRPDDVRRRHRAMEDAQRRREDQPRFGGIAELHRGPEQRVGRTSHRFGRDGADLEFIEQAFQDARSGHAAVAPFSDGVIPTSLDPTLCPDGTHIMSLFTQWVPADWNAAPHTEELEAYADRLIDLYEAVAPNFKSSILHRDIVGPHEMETEYGLIGGNIFHGELSLEQLFHMRPAPGYADYRTPIAGLYNGGSATHAGGGVCGIPGWQAARAALADRKRKPQRVQAALARRADDPVMTTAPDAVAAMLRRGDRTRRCEPEAGELRRPDDRRGDPWRGRPIGASRQSALRRDPWAAAWRRSSIWTHRSTSRCWASTTTRWRHSCAMPPRPASDRP